ncbi:MAG: polysaccharide deacetylase family protein [Clostridia bacterium]|nr:polysaccharide deacetylase family protein [Clostridia bacterium]
MTKSRLTAYIAIGVAVVMLVASLICSIAMISKKNSRISQLKADIAQNTKLLEEQADRQKELEAQLEGGSDENARISAELEKAKSEIDRLEKENSKLKIEIEKLSVQKEQAEKNQTTSAPIIPAGTKPCYLTFDDGPSQNTLQILQILKKYNAKATFFVTKSSDVAYVRNIYVEGHAVGLHTASHVYEKIYKSEDAYFADLKLISDTVENIIGEKPDIVRFPGGSSNNVSAKSCKGIMSRLVKALPQKGYAYFDWNVDSGDAANNLSSYTRIVNNVLSQAKNKSSICVLMHDSKAKTTTVKALPYIIEGLAEQGFYFDVLTSDINKFHHNVIN